MYSHIQQRFSVLANDAGGVGSVGDVGSSACRDKTTNGVSSERDCVQWVRTKWKWTTDDGSAQRKYYYEFGDIWTDRKHDNIIIATKDFYLCANASPSCSHHFTCDGTRICAALTVGNVNHFQTKSLRIEISLLWFFDTNSVGRPMCSLSSAILASSLWKSICFYRPFVRRTRLCAWANKSVNNCRK